MAEGRTQLADQARQGQRKAAGGLHTLADQLHDMSQKADGEGLAPEIARQAAERTRGVASWLDEREPGALVEEVRRFARRKPGAFLAGAAIAGVLVGRLTRGAVAAASDDSSGDSRGDSSGSNGAPAARPMPTTPPATSPHPYAAPAPGAVPGQPRMPAPGYSAPPAPPPVTQPRTWDETPAQYPGPVTR
jgi:hypothetical protein